MREATSKAVTGAVPNRPRGRLLGVDVARGVALLGMMAIHIMPSEGPDGGRSVAYLVAQGRSAAAFAFLAGVGLSLATARARVGPHDRWLGVPTGVAVRGLAIGAIGLTVGYADTGLSLILAYYAVFFLLAVPLLRLRAGALAALALGAATVAPVFSHVARRTLPEPVLGSPTWTHLMADPARLLVELMVTGSFPALPWMAYLCAGLAVGRLPLRSPRVAAALLAGGMALAVAAVSTSWLLLDVAGGREAIAASMATVDPGQLEGGVPETEGTTPATTWWWLAVAFPHSSSPLDLLHTTGTAIALLGGCLLACRVADRALMPLAAVGSMTLTLYTVHVLTYDSPHLPVDPLPSYAVQAGAALLGAMLWRAAARRGPLEVAVAALSGSAARAVFGRRYPDRAVAGQRRSPHAGPATYAPPASSRPGSRQ